MQLYIKRIFSVAVLLFIIPSINIYPVTGTSEDAVRELERRRYETEKRLREKERLEIERYKEDKEKKKEITEPVGDGTGFFISKIIIENSEQLSDREKDNLIGPYLNRVIAINDITLLVGSITNRLVEKGYITSRVKVPVDQQLKSGVLVLTVVKGYIANIKPEEDSLSTRMQVFTAFPLLEGKYLNIEDLDYGVEQMNRLRSNNATMKILPGEELGFSDIIIYNEQGERLTLDIGVDNLGQKNTGEKRGKISAGFENPFNINDSISADYTTSLNTDIDRKYNRSWSFNYSFPLGYWSFSSTYSRSEYMQYVYGLSRDFRSSGIDTSIVFGADRMLGRIKDNRFKGRASLTLKDKKNFIEDAIVESSSRKLTIVRFGLDYNTFIYGGYFSANAFYNRGLELFGAYKDDGDMEIETPRAQFEKYDMSLMWNRSFMLFGQSFGYLFNLTGQWGMETLYSSEKISIGDMNTVRGFKGSSISGDRGFYIRNDFSVFDFSRLWNPLKGVKYFVAYDYGYAVERTGRDANFGAGEGSVMGWATGISYSSGVADMSVTYARQLFSPWFVKEENYVVYFAATLKLTGLFNEARVAFR